MRLLLIRPARTPQSVTLGEIMFSEPIGLEMVASALKEAHEVDILDLMAAPEEDLIKKLNTFRPAAVGITSLCVDVPAVCQLAHAVKVYNPDICTVVGGTQAFLDPEAFFTAQIDHVVRFSSIETLKSLFGAIESSHADGLFPLLDGVHSRQLNYADTGARRPNAHWLPDREITAPWRDRYAYFGYRPCAILQTSQGCSAHCEFCLRWRMEGPCENDFPMSVVMSELKSIRESSVMIFDNDFLHDGQRLLQFCEQLDLEGLEKNFICYASVHSVLANPEPILNFKAHGLKAVLIGYESFKDQDLDDYKKPSEHSDNLRAANWLKKAGIDVWASFILHPDWDHTDFKMFRKDIRRLKPEIATFSPLTPFPGLPLYAKYKERLLFKREDYTAWSFGQVTIQPGKMTLRAYYLEVLMTVLYLNFVSNHLSYIVKKFGAGTLPRLVRGSLKVFGRYVKLMWNAS